MLMNESRFWRDLWDLYPLSPSVALCRVPELEYAATLDMSGKTLDHCCGDGLFAQMAWKDVIPSAGCDLNPNSIKKAERKHRHGRHDVCDASARLPYDDANFDLVFNNSALEHIPDLRATLREVTRVLKPGGTFAFNVLNHRYFEWWPLTEEDAKGYREWQPFHHALDIDAWRAELEQVGLSIESYNGYFDREASQLLAWLDCEFSGYHIVKRKSALVSWYLRFPLVARWYWKRRIGAMRWETEPDAGAGYFIKAVKANG